jgi:hypothetical protein
MLICLLLNLKKNTFHSFIVNLPNDISHRRNRFSGAHLLLHLIESQSMGNKSALFIDLHLR